MLSPLTAKSVQTKNSVPHYSAARRPCAEITYKPSIYFGGQSTLVPAARPCGWTLFEDTNGRG